MLRGMMFFAFLVQFPWLEIGRASEAQSRQNRSTFVEIQANGGLFLQNVIDTSAWDPPSPDPVGIDYHPGLGRLIVSDSEVDEMAIFQGANIFEATTSGQLVATCSTLSFANEPSGITVNPANGHIFITQDDRGRIYEVAPTHDGDQCSFDQVVNIIDTRGFNSYDLEGLAFGEGKLFIAEGEDAEGAKIIVLSAGENEVFDGVSPAGDDVIASFETSNLSLRDPEGIGFHPERGTLFIVSRTEKVLVETTTDGTALAAYDLSFTGIQKPAGVAIGPNSQNPDKYSIFISARGVDNDLNPNENDGKIYELGFLEPVYFPLMFR
jgi:DNA-binding beta-propeller fold protein YncE